MKYSFYSIRQGKSSPVLCGPSISVEMEINYPYLHGLQECGTTKYQVPEPCDKLFEKLFIFFLTLGGGSITPNILSPTTS